jgi:ABC-type uncharacterized transport system involved in gliding motility auxiliary subunit
MKTWLFPLWVIISILILLSSVVLWIAAPEYKTLNIGLSLFGTCLLLLLMSLRMKEIKIYVRSHYFKHVLYHSINVFLILGILGVINYLGNKNFREFDFTKDKSNTLTEQSRRVLEMVKKPMKMTLYAKREEWSNMLSLLKLYEGQNHKIEMSAIDTDVRPDLVKSEDIAQNGSVVLTYEGKKSQFVLVDELSVTNALLKILRDEKIVLYFVTGHQELTCEDTTNEGISSLCEKLRAQNYEVKNLDLTKIKAIPRDATGVFILGPISGYLPQEAALLETYLKSGGSMFLSLAPAFKAELYDNLVKLAHPFGLNMGKDIVIDRISTVQGAEATIPIIEKYDPEHPITAGFAMRTIFPLSASVRNLEGNDTATILARTSGFPGSWAESDLTGVTKGKAEYQEKSDLKGPIGLIGVGERREPNASRDSRFVLLGSSSFLVNAYQGQSGNTTLFLNSVSWMANDEGIISLNRPGVEEVPIILSAQHLQLIFIVSILLVPIIFFGAAIFVYRRRRIL